MSESPQFPEGYPPVQNDPFPKMIIVCLAITAVGLVLIFTLLLFEFIQRGTTRNAGPAAPFAVPAPQAPSAPPQAP